MAVGNVGEFLDPAADATCTWLSRDGGLNWKVSGCCISPQPPISHVQSSKENRQKLQPMALQYSAVATKVQAGIYYLS